MEYTLDFKCKDDNEIQVRLNELYSYKNDINTKVFHRSRINLFYTLFQDLIAKGIIQNKDKALDIGCNAGFFSKIISDFGFKEVRGVDISESLVAKANTFFASKETSKLIKFEALNAENLDLSLKYDFILCTEVIEHTENPEKVVTNIKSILNEGGVAIITLPNVVSFPYIFTYIAFKLLRKEISTELKQHMSYPFYKSIKMFKERDLRVVKTTGTNLFFSETFLPKFYRTPFFEVVNKFNFKLSKLFPLKYFTQFFFIVLKKEN